MHLSKKEKGFLNFFFQFSKFRFHFQHSREKDDPHSSCIFELRDFRKRG